MTDDREQSRRDRLESFDYLADQVNSGVLTMMAAKAVWFSLIEKIDAPAGDEPTEDAQ